MENTQTHLDRENVARHGQLDGNVDASDVRAGVGAVVAGRCTIPGRNAGGESKPKPIDFRVVRKLHDVLDLDHDGLGGGNSADGRAEDIRGVLLEEARGLMGTLDDGGAEFGAGVVFLFDDAVDDPSPDRAPKSDDGAGVVEREGVLCAWDRRGAGGIDEGLGEGGAGCGVVEGCSGGEGELG